MSLTIVIFVIFEISTLKFVCLQNFTKKQERLNLGQKIPDLSILGLEFWKLLSYLKSASSNLSIRRISRKTKMPKLRTENALFEYFWARILESCCHIWNQHLRISATAKFCEETNMPKFGTKNALLGIFDQQCLIWVFLG